VFDLRNVITCDLSLNGLLSQVSSAEGILVSGFKSGHSCKGNLFGCGFYACRKGVDALQYCPLEMDICVLICKVIIGPTKIGVRGEVNFGHDDHGRRVLTATSESGDFMCCTNSAQILSTHCITLRRTEDGFKAAKDHANALSKSQCPFSVAKSIASSAAQPLNATSAASTTPLSSAARPLIATSAASTTPFSLAARPLIATSAASTTSLSLAAQPLNATSVASKTPLSLAAAMPSLSFCMKTLSDQAAPIPFGHSDPVSHKTTGFRGFFFGQSVLITHQTQSYWFCNWREATIVDIITNGPTHRLIVCPWDTALKFKILCQKTRGGIHSGNKGFLSIPLTHAVKIAKWPQNSDNSFAVQAAKHYVQWNPYEVWPPPRRATGFIYYHDHCAVPRKDGWSEVFHTLRFSSSSIIEYALIGGQYRAKKLASTMENMRETKYAFFEIGHSVQVEGMPPALSFVNGKKATIYFEGETGHSNCPHAHWIWTLLFWDESVHRELYRMHSTSSFPIGEIPAVLSHVDEWPSASDNWSALKITRLFLHWKDGQKWPPCSEAPSPAIPSTSELHLRSFDQYRGYHIGQSVVVKFSRTSLQWLVGQNATIVKMFKQGTTERAILALWDKSAGPRVVKDRSAGGWMSGGQGLLSTRFTDLEGIANWPSKCDNPVAVDAAKKSLDWNPDQKWPPSPAKTTGKRILGDFLTGSQ